jgi:hypothetical protein
MKDTRVSLWEESKHNYVIISPGFAKQSYRKKIGMKLKLLRCLEVADSEWVQ